MALSRSSSSRSKGFLVLLDAIIALSLLLAIVSTTIFQEVDEPDPVEIAYLKALSIAPACKLFLENLAKEDLSSSLSLGELMIVIDSSETEGIQRLFDSYTERCYGCLIIREAS